ncbi:MAG: hypothetical protein HRT38_19970 [Alteromonadaceae bacterium]|nr:hypothetical protein [Alteromonadaceae bacterium]
MHFYYLIKKELRDAWDYLGGLFIKDKDGFTDFFFITAFAYSEAKKAKSGWELSSIQILFLNYLDQWGNRSFVLNKHLELGLAMANYFSTMQCQEQYIYVDKKAGILEENLDLESPRRKVILNSLVSILSHMPTELKPVIDQRLQCIEQELARYKENNDADIFDEKSAPLTMKLKLLAGIVIVIMSILAITGVAPMGMAPP